MQSIRLVIIGFVTTVLLTSGCSGNFFSGGTSSVTDTYTPEFSDVPIPRDMGIETSYTEVTQAGNLRVGHMRFTGRVEWSSLIDACIYNMYTQGWSPIAIYKQKSGLLVFEKDERVCVMMFTSSLINTEMWVWVNPRMHGFTSPPTMPVAPAPVEATENHEQVQSGGGSSQSGGSGTEYSPSSSGSSGGGSSSYSGGGVNEQSLDE